VRHPAAKGLRESDRLPEPIFTPATKEEKGKHDENISFDRMVAMVGSETAEKVRSIVVALYEKAASYAREKGILIADTKFELGRGRGADPDRRGAHPGFLPVLARRRLPARGSAEELRQAIRPRLPADPAVEQDRAGPRLPADVVEKTA